jgi:predicted house-cleaning noncanonical NTP pyrophosphatase (MazG superfamily)
MKKTHNKLVRDKIPRIISADGKQSKTRILEDKEYMNELVKKLQEEVIEMAENPSVGELAEITIAIRGALGIHAGQLEEVRCQRPLQKQNLFRER